MRFFRTLKELGMATTKGTKSGTLVSLTNYGFYQYGWNTNGPTDGTSNGTSDGTTDGTTDGTQTRTKEALKKNVKEEGTSGGISNRKELISADGDDYQ